MCTHGVGRVSCQELIGYLQVCFHYYSNDVSKVLLLANYFQEATRVK